MNETNIDLIAGQEHPLLPKVIKGFCVECGHRSFDHEIAIGTPQTGSCLKCDCPQLEAPSREELGDELDRYRLGYESLAALVKSQEATIAEMREALQAANLTLANYVDILLDIKNGRVGHMGEMGQVYAGRTFQKSRIDGKLTDVIECRTNVCKSLDKAQAVLDKWKEGK